MTERYCLGCRRFHDKREPACPTCGRPASAFNAGLVSSQWASALNEKAARVISEG